MCYILLPESFRELVGEVTPLIVTCTNHGYSPFNIVIMKKKDLYGEGFSGLQVEFSLVELTALKQFREELSIISTNVTNTLAEFEKDNLVVKHYGKDPDNKFSSEDAVLALQNAYSLMKSAEKLLTELVPSTVLSVNEAYNSLFGSSEDNPEGEQLATSR